MLSLTILQVKDFMSKLLINDTFHSFLLVEAVITMSYQITIDGHLQKNFFDKEEREIKDILNRKYSYWKEIKPICYQIIKGSKTPLGFKFVFRLADADVNKFIEQSGLALKENDINGLFIHITFDGKRLTGIAASSLTAFSMDKSLDYAWDRFIKEFLKSNRIPFEEL